MWNNSLTQSVRLCGYRLLGFLVALFVPAGILWAVPARQAVRQMPPPQAFLQVNQFYFLYTYPVVPYLTRTGVMMVGLEGMARGLFAHAPAGDPQAKAYGGDDYGRVQTDVQARRETLTLGSHILVFTAGSATAQEDGQPMPMEAPARWDVATEQMVVPAQSLVQGLGLTSQWNAQRRVLSVTAPDKMTSTDADNNERINDLTDFTSLVPWRVTYHPTDIPKNVIYPTGAYGGPRWPWLMIEAKNMSSVTLDREALNIVILYSKAGMTGNLDGLGDIVGNGPSPAIRPHGIRHFPLALQGGGEDGSFPLCVVSYMASAPPLSVSASLGHPSSPSAGFIDPSITGKEREIVAKAMAGLRPEDRQNVIVVEPDGTTYANHPQLKHLFSPLKPIGGNLYRTQNNGVIALPGPEPKPTASVRGTPGMGVKTNVANPSFPYPGTGPYIRFYTTPPASDSAQGFAYESANVFLPGVIPAAINVSENPTDLAAASIYLGGWSAGTSPEALDVGFAHEGATSAYASMGWNEDWVAFFGIGSTKENPGTQNLYSNPPWQYHEIGHAIRFASNQTASIAFYVSGSANAPQLNFIWGGNCYDFSTYQPLGNNRYALVYLPGTNANWNWNPQGDGMILKSMTSIAQEQSQQHPEDDFFDGSLVRSVQWSNFMLCPTGTGTPKPASSYADGNVQFYPDNGSVNITSDGNFENLNPYNSWNRTDSIIVP